MRRVFRIPFSRNRLVREVDDEIAFHVQSRIDALVASGLPRDEARAAALKQFGDLTTVRENCSRQTDSAKPRTAAPTSSPSCART
jgi:hypothetical protein